MKKKVAFYINPQAHWLGGVNYYKNLFFSLKCLGSNKIFEYFVFMPLSAKEYLFENYFDGNIIYDDSFLIKFSDALIHYISLYKIDILSHMSIFSDKFDCKIINWIPDFQHKYLPELFTEEELRFRDNRFELYAKYAQKVILSSHDAQKDFAKFLPEFKNKSAVLQFTSFVDFDELLLSVNDNIDNTRFFFLPNQFWQHKNHLTVFKAILELKKQGFEVNLICSGYMHDYRNSEHVMILKKFITDNKLENNIRLLGMISSKQLYGLMYNSLCVINPSLFEGWSTTVEECKTMGKVMIVSDIKVHKEQNPEGYYFNSNDYIQLSRIMKDVWIQSNNKYNKQSINNLKNSMMNKLINMGNNYEKILDSVFFE